ncbi:hypothetical protein K6119_14445 [Paracrocinitomix mangrovi]|uniref:hypothetical protein n=1 Tax=Paracrocinitomix mangrovi TaxID=2862509 RepID=UPI001C8E37BE|nr:hypothetical protein [Paracrocinitomix mangrovi]UKN00931.1 hypothetical protein K6119_14445 [Paracrocinitomix mangrovi]
MKLNRTAIVGALLIGGIAFVTPSCKKKGCTDVNATNYNPEAKKDDPDNPCVYPSWYTEVEYSGTVYKQITGTLTEDYTLDANSNWLLSGGVFVGDGATLTIDAGTTVYTADDGTVPFLAISQGGKINACGTATDPIVFTPVSSTPAAGDWGGIILNGYAPINTGATAEGEGGTGTYGGTDAADNSGTMCYVRVEYAGKLLSVNNELNGFSFNGVGSGTTLHHLQAYRGNDDGFEFFGGTVSLTYALSTGNGDDSFDWTHGWSGTGENWIVEQDPTTGDRGIEADNNGDNNSASPMSSPTLSKITIMGRGVSAGKVGIKLREGTAGILSNILIEDCATGIDIQHDVTVANVTAGTLDISGVTTTNVTTDIVVSATTGTDSTNAATMGAAAVDGTGTGADSGWTTGWTKAL